MDVVHPTLELQIGIIECVSEMTLKPNGHDFKH